MKKLLSIIVAAVLASFALTNPMTASADSLKDYVSEVYVSAAANEQSAKKYLTDNGYKVLDHNLNDGTGEKAVYMGYKTTNDPKDAITDLKVMDMNGGYSQTDYEAMVAKEKSAIAANAGQLGIVIDEFKKNYEARSPMALLAYKNLNQYKDQKEDSRKNLKCDEGKTDLLMGDYFLSGSMTDDNLATLLLQGNSKIIESLYQYLALGTFASGEKSIIEKLVEADPNAEISADLDDTAKTIVDCWDVMYDGLAKYDEAEVKFSDSEEDVNAYLETLNDVEKLNYIKYGTLYEIANELNFNDGTLLDYFMQEDVRTKDVYVLANVLTPAQTVVLPHVGLANLLTINGAKEASDNTEEFVDDVTTVSGAEEKEAEPVSVYLDVDQNLFNGNVALTSEALAYQNASGDSPWYDANVNYYLSLGCYITTGLAVGVAAISGITYLVKAEQIAKYAASVDNLEKAYTAAQMHADGLRAIYEGVNTTYQTAARMRSVGDYTYSLEECNAMFKNFNSIFDEYKTAKAAANAKYDAYQEALGNMGSASAWGWTFTAATGIALIAQGVYYGVKIYNYYHPDYTVIPQIMCDKIDVVGENNETKTDYVYYYAAKQNIDGDSDKKYGEYADLNGFTGKQWNALYSTKDAKAGNPILADSLKVKVGDNTTEKDATAVSLFHTTAAYNVNSHQYNDKNNGIYISYKTEAKETKSNSTASVFTAGNIALMVGIGIAVGVLSGTACAVITNKKMKKSTTKKED